MSARRQFRSDVSAQSWFEWQCHGRFFPGIAIFVCSVIFVVAFLREGRYDSFGLMTCLIASFAWPIFASIGRGAEIARMSPIWAKVDNSLEFVAIRPLTSWQVVAAKFRMTLRSVLIGCGIIVASIAAWIAITGHVDDAGLLWHGYAARYPGWRGFVLAGLGSLFFPFLIWRLMTDLLPIGLTGRRWLIGWITVLVVFVFTVIAGLPIHVWARPSDLRILAAFLPGVVVAAAILKFLTASWAYRECVRRGLMSARDPVFFLGGWACASILAAAFAMLLIPSGMVSISPWVACLAAIALVPLGRFPLAVLAFEWNRHR